MNGHQIDAIYLAQGQITVIDFKDYEGRLSFSESNPWRMDTPSGETVFVQGGAKSRNPFQQVRAYRFSLMHFLSDNEASIPDGVRNKLELGHIGCIILFQRKVKFDNNALPPLISRYFQVHDISSIQDALSDRYSQGLELSDNEIRNILKVLDVREGNLLQNHNFEERTEKSQNVDASKLTLIKRLINGKKTDSALSRVMGYYKTLINVERFKEPTAASLHALPLDLSQDFSRYKINLAASSEFHQVYLRNRQERYPKNIFVGLSLILNGKGYPLLHTILLVSDIRGKDEIEVDLHSFELYHRSLGQMGLGEDILEELVLAINDATTLEEKLIRIREQLDLSVELDSHIVVGLSTESLFSAQLISELNNLSKSKETDVHSDLFKSFLFNTLIKHRPQALQLNPFVSVSPLNSAQEKTVKMAFEQPLTVVTGPPGTGKSQVVANILANAMVNGHSCLFVSKNNKAVDNVKDRMDALLKEPYLIRFGSREEVTNNAKPILSRFVTRKNQEGFENREEALQESLQSIRKDVVRIHALQSQIEEIPVLERDVIQFQAYVSELKKEREKWLSTIRHEHRKLFLEQGLTVQADSNQVGLMIQKISRWQGGFIKRLLFDWFLKTKFLEKVKAVNDIQSAGIYNLLEREAPWVKPDLDILESSKANLSYILKLKKQSSELISANQEKVEKIETLLLKLGDSNRKLEELIKSKPAFEEEIRQLKALQDTKGKEALNLSVNQRLYALGPLGLQQYIDYLPSNDVWQDEEVEGFAQCTKSFLDTFKGVCLTSLTIKNSFPLKEGVVDVLVVDEASQCDIASAIPLIYRAKRLVVIGDPLQLTHITNVQKFEDEYLKEGLGLEGYQLNYVEKSLYDYCFDLANKCSIESVFLQEHYRCHPEIINFSNSNFYEQELGQSMLVKTNDQQYQLAEKGLRWKHVEGEMHSSKNVNMGEVNRCVDLATKLRHQYPEASIGIVTPFNDQYRAIFEKLPKEIKETVKVDTVHKYQGDEKDIMIFSTVVTDNSPSGKAWFINRNANLINVAVTRARGSLYIVGNHRYCKSLNEGKRKTPLSLLASYAEHLQRLI